MGFPWISSLDVVGRKSNVPCIVDLFDKKRQFVAMAFCSPNSKIYLRIFSRKKTDLNGLFWKKKIEEALQRREGIEEVTNAYRIVYAESDFLPSMIIDKYNDIISFQITSAGGELVKEDIMKVILEIFSPVSIIEKNKGGFRKEEGLPLIEKVVFGEKEITRIREGDKEFEVNIVTGQKTGGYLDYRRFRLKMKEWARGKCLDAFCYQGWVACHLADVAKKVVAIDISEGAMDSAKNNARINNIHNVEFVVADVFEYLAACQEKFDFIHLDPPSFVKDRQSLAGARVGYKKLFKLACKLLNSNGIIFLSSCSHQISERMLEEVTKGGEVMYRGIQDRDHPLLKGFSQSLYLKGIAVKPRNRL